MNFLKVNEQHTILTLHAHGWSQRRIARELGFHRETVGKYLRQAAAIPALAKAMACGPAATADAKPATISTPGSEPPASLEPATISTLGSDTFADPKPATIATFGCAGAVGLGVTSGSTAGALAAPPLVGCATGADSPHATAAALVCAPACGEPLDGAPPASAACGSPPAAVAAPALRLSAACASPPAATTAAPGSTDGPAAALGPAAAPAPPANTTAGRRSLCEQLRPVIEAGLVSGLSAQRIFQDLVTEHAFAGSYQSVKRFARQLGATAALPFRRMECVPGEELQIDFGQGAWVEADGKRRRPHLFRAVLSHSRKGYSEVVWHQNTETFLRCIENAFRYFGGVTRTAVIDNLKAGVLRADWYDPDLNPKLFEFAIHYGTTILPTKPAMPRHKGKIESGVNYAQENALKGRRFASLGEENRFLAEWERNVADTRIHGTMRQQVGKLFDTVERPALLPLPASIFPSFTEERRNVHRDGHVEYQKAYYSAPPEYMGREVWLRADSRLVRLFNQRMETIATHVRVQPGLFATADEHLHAHKRHPVERGADYLLARCQLLGTNAGAWAQAMLQNRGAYHLRVLQGLLQLAGKHPVAQLERATGTALHHGAFRLGDVKRLLEHGESVVQVDFLQAHPLIRDLSAYSVAAFPSCEP